ncbi:DUF3885 domain-containing protein [Paenibacillus dendritiformis]|uniref:DUF3885 domain-containing protein n=1 Tax=Paenibacillus dendritiformis TaxID=130049 RepID=UPI003B972974
MEGSLPSRWNCGIRFEIAIPRADHEEPCNLRQIKERSIGTINKTKQIIYHLYDDRGCDVLCAALDPLRPLYEEFNDWILEYDREKNRGSIPVEQVPAIQFHFRRMFNHTFPI